MPTDMQPTSNPQIPRNQEPGESGLPVRPAGAAGTHLHDQINRIGHLLQDTEAAMRSREDHSLTYPQQCSRKLLSASV